MIKLRHSLTPAWIVASLLATLPFTTAGAEEAPADINWTVELKPGGKGFSVTGRVPNAKAADVGRWTAGMIASARLVMVPSEQDLVFRYTAPVDQVVFSNPLNPVLNDRQFCGFGRHLLVFPELKDRTFKRFSLTIKHPEDWTLVTSLGTGTGTGAETLTFDKVDDLRGLMICAGDYTVKEFTLPNKTRRDTFSSSTASAPSTTRNTSRR